jgi:hypothetical protein
MYAGVSLEGNNHWRPQLFVSSAKKQLFRQLRAETGWFPNLNYEETIRVGSVGTFDGSRCEFSWITTLDVLAVSAPDPIVEDASTRVDRLFCSGDSTDVDFNVDENAFGTASFGFSGVGSAASQTFGSTSRKLDIYRLEIALNEKLGQGMNWNRHWVVVTQVFPAKAFSVLSARSSRAAATLRTRVPVTGSTFNIADPALGITCNRSHGDVRHATAVDVTPYFKVCKLKGWKPWSSSRYDPNERKRLEPYG